MKRHRLGRFDVPERRKNSIRQSGTRNDLQGNSAAKNQLWLRWQWLHSQALRVDIGLLENQEDSSMLSFDTRNGHRGSTGATEHLQGNKFGPEGVDSTRKSSKLTLTRWKTKRSDLFFEARPEIVSGAKARPRIYLKATCLASKASASLARLTPCR